MALIAAYTFDEASPPYASAVSGAPDLEVTAGSPASVAGKLSNGVEFPGGLSSHSLQTASAGTLAFTGDISIACWVKQTDTLGFPISAPIIQLVSASGHYIKLELGRVGSIAPFGAAYDGTQVAADLAAALTINTWYHLAVTFDNTTGTVRIYLNGVLIEATTDATVVLTENWTYLLVEGSLTATTIIDELMIFDHVLTAGDILGLADDEDGQLCIESIEVCPAILYNSVSAEPALLCQVEVNKCQP